MTFSNVRKGEVDGKSYVTDRDRPFGNSEAVSDGYFTALGLKVLEGRDFTIDDMDAKQPVAIVNASFAKKYFGNESAIGRRIRRFNPAKTEAWRTIVGVVPETLMQGPFNQQTDNSGFYTPLLGTAEAPQFATLIVRPHPGQSAASPAPSLVPVTIEEMRSGPGAAALAGASPCTAVRTSSVAALPVASCPSPSLPAPTTRPRPP